MTESNEKDQQSGKNIEASTEDAIQKDAAQQRNVDNAESTKDEKEQIRASDEPAAKKDLQVENKSKAQADREGTPEVMQTVEDFNLNLLLDIPLEITVELGRAKIQIQELLKLGPGSTATLSKLEGEPVDILANDRLIARGEVVVQDQKYGICITEITSRMDRIKSLS